MRLLGLAPVFAGLVFGFPALAQQVPGAPAAGSPAQPETQAGQPAPDLQAGGLRPPEAVDAPEAEPEARSEAEVEQELDRAEQEDTGRGLEFVWLQGEAGYDLLWLQALSGSSLVDGSVVSENQHGPVVGAGLGVRVFVITAGARFRYATFQDFSWWTLDAEAGLRIPMGRLDLYVTLGGGYGSASGFGEGPSSDLDLSKLALTGFNLRTGGGAEFYFSETFSVGASINGEVAFLKRSAVDTPSAPAGDLAVYAEDASSVGARLTTTAYLGLHF